MGSLIWWRYAKHGIVQNGFEIVSNCLDESYQPKAGNAKSGLGLRSGERSTQATT